MGTAVAEPETNETPEAPVAEAERTREDLFEYSRWLHVGEGALACEHNLKPPEEGGPVRATGKCSNPDHFHAWLRLPNQFQIRDIVEKARAAQARRKRLLRDPESDASVILDAELDEMRDESLLPVIVEELLEESYYEIYRQATEAVAALEDEAAEPDEESGEQPKLYAQIEQDREEYERLQTIPEEERDADEFKALEKRIADYSRAVTEKIESLQTPRRETLQAKGLDDLIAMVRRRRVEVLATEVYLHTFNTWQWYVCTFKATDRGTPRERLWSDIAQMKYETPKIVVEALQENFKELESKLARTRGLGNF